MTGPIAFNAHKGSSSEYLAQYIFSCFGTAIAVPHQEDSGIDLHCTILERIGKRGWPREHFSVQVKSTMDPWIFDGEESVRWLIEHPLPLFLCVVDKKSARIRVYQTSPPFHAWARPPLSDRIVLIPAEGTEGERSTWKDGIEFSLSAPMLEIEVARVLEDEAHHTFSEVMKLWLKIERANLNRIAKGIHRFVTPLKYRTNSTQVQGEGGQSKISFQDLEKAAENIKEQLNYLAYYFHGFGKLSSAACCAMLLRRIGGEDIFEHFGIGSTPILGRISRLMQIQGDQGIDFAGVDALNEMIDQKLEPPKEPSQKSAASV